MKIQILKAALPFVAAIAGAFATNHAAEAKKAVTLKPGHFATTCVSASVTCSDINNNIPCTNTNNVWMYELNGSVCPQRLFKP